MVFAVSSLFVQFKHSICSSCELEVQVSIKLLGIYINSTKVNFILQPNHGTIISCGLPLFESPITLVRLGSKKADSDLKGRSRLDHWPRLTWHFWERSPTMVIVQSRRGCPHAISLPTPEQLLCLQRHCCVALLFWENIIIFDNEIYLFVRTMNNEQC